MRLSRSARIPPEIYSAALGHCNRGATLKHSNVLIIFITLGSIQNFTGCFICIFHISHLQYNMLYSFNYN